MEPRDYSVEKILQDMNCVPFEIEDDRRHLCVPRLAVYYESCYKRNRDLFVKSLLPELDRISQLLNEEEVSYRGIDRENHEFNQVDVEMAVFAFGSKQKIFPMLL